MLRTTTLSNGRPRSAVQLTRFVASDPIVVRRFALRSVVRDRRRRTAHENQPYSNYRPHLPSTSTACAPEMRGRLQIRRIMRAVLVPLLR